MVPSIHRHARKRFGAQQFDELLDCRIRRNGDDLRPRLHGLANSLFAELDHRLDQVSIAFVENAFFLTGFDQRVHRFSVGLRSFVRVLLGQCGDRLQEAQHQRDRQREIDQNAQNPAAAHQPFAARPGKEDKRQKTVEQNDDQYQAERGLKNFVDTPAPLVEHREAHQQGDRSRHDLGQHRHGERGAGAADSQLGLNSLLEAWRCCPGTRARENFRSRYRRGRRTRRASAGRKTTATQLQWHSSSSSSRPCGAGAPARGF